MASSPRWRVGRPGTVSLQRAGSAIALAYPFTGWARTERNTAMSLVAKLDHRLCGGQEEVTPSPLSLGQAEDSAGAAGRGRLRAVMRLPAIERCVISGDSLSQSEIARGLTSWRAGKIRKAVSATSFSVRPGSSLACEPRASPPRSAWRRSSYGYGPPWRLPGVVSRPSP